VLNNRHWKDFIDQNQNALPSADVAATSFGVSPPSVHQMVLTLERAAFIARKPGVARSIEILIDPQHLPALL
jgi:DNA-binding transcriptional regulator YdaS (Cro superfamily)